MISIWMILRRLLLAIFFFSATVQSFHVHRSLPMRPLSQQYSPRTVLCAKKTKKSRPSTLGFGGAAVEDCPCGSGEQYRKCCGKLHKKVNELTKATPEQVVRARYAAYAKREIDFLIKSTHPQNKNFNPNIQAWRKEIDVNCYDNFELCQCDILDQEILEEDKQAKVTFVANMIQKDSRERTAFQETSIFELIGGAWLYKGGEIGDPPGREEGPNEDDQASETTAEEIDSSSEVEALGKDP